MKKIWLVVLAVAAILATAPAAKADPTYYFSFSVSTSNSIPGTDTISGSGILSGKAISGYPGEYNITGGTFAISIDGGPSTGETIVGCATPLSVCHIPQIYYDNILMPGDPDLGSGPQYLTDNGLVIQMPSSVQFPSGAQINIFFDDYTGDAIVGDYLWNVLYPNGDWLIVDNGNNEGGYDSANFDITPEPSSLILLGTGLLSMAGFLFWKAKPGMVRER